MESQNVLISSKDRTSGSSSDGRVPLPTSLRGNYRVKFFTMTNNMYNVNAENNVFSVTHSAADFDVTLTHGQYSALDLGVHVASLLTTAVAGATYTATYNATTHKTTLTTDMGSFLVRVGTANRLMGFDTESDQTTAASAQTSPNPMDMHPYKQIYIRFNEYDDLNIWGSDHFNASVTLPVNAVFGGLIQYSSKEYGDQIMKFDTLRHIQYRFIDDAVNNITVNSEWLLVLERVP